LSYAGLNCPSLSPRREGVVGDLLKFVSKQMP
jgi:hypothetical protein